jgi:hypothetical protein
MNWILLTGCALLCLGLSILLRLAMRRLGMRHITDGWRKGPDDEPHS